jgi:hypothetical protein
MANETLIERTETMLRDTCMRIDAGYGIDIRAQAVKLLEDISTMREMVNPHALAKSILHEIERFKTRDNDGGGTIAQIERLALSEIEVGK